MQGPERSLQKLRVAPTLQPSGQVNWLKENSVKPPLRDHCSDGYVAETQGNESKHNLERILFFKTHLSEDY